MSSGPMASFGKFCISCKQSVPLDRWNDHLKTNEHKVMELARMEKDLKSDPEGWVERNWPPRWDAGKWCDRCNKLVLYGNWYAHLESHRRRRIRRPRM